jgi:hypothetical protein
MARYTVWQGGWDIRPRNGREKFLFVTMLLAMGLVAYSSYLIYLKASYLSSATWIATFFPMVLAVVILGVVAVSMFEVF